VGNPFDKLSKTAFGVVRNSMGDAASWTPSAGGAALTGRVLFKDNSAADLLLESQESGAVVMEPQKPTAEYYADQFAGLKAAVDAGKYETLIITGIGSYHVTKVNTLVDGKTFTATLVKVKE
jgi:hypothetical protein